MPYLLAKIHTGCGFEVEVTWKKKSCNVTCKLHCNFVLCNSRFNCDGLKSEIRFTIFLIATIIYHHTKPVLQFEIVFFLLSNLFPYKLCLQKMTYQKKTKSATNFFGLTIICDIWRRRRKFLQICHKYQIYLRFH